MTRSRHEHRCKTSDLAQVRHRMPFGRRPRSAVITLARLAAVLAVAGCARAIPTTQGAHATLSADHSYLVDQGGHALYLFKADKKAESYCTDACASVWPPYETSGQPTAGKGVSQRLLATIVRGDGGRQVTYAGMPLYYYAGDGGKRDQTSGEGISQFGADWYLVSSKDGASVESTSTGGGSSSSKGSGY
ncbi:MAG: hypothetical protein M3071_02420 [Actinomycetota bacterium]|nr:hypothetical protein [Actinomycetota bacterium]